MKQVNRLADAADMLTQEEQTREANDPLLLFPPFLLEFSGVSKENTKKKKTKRKKKKN